MTESISMNKQNETVKIKDINPSLWNQQSYNYYHEEEDDNTSIEEEEEEEDAEYDTEAIVCGCGKALSPGWNCTQCRHNCSTCHRALATEEICSRCPVERDTSSKTTVAI